jgi:polysaccharide biosynthesis protein PslH
MKKPELLVLLSRFPYPLEKGDKLRAYNQLIELSKEYEITLVALCDHDVPKEHVEKIKQYCAVVHIERLNYTSKLCGIVRSLLNGNPFQVGYFFRKSIQKKIVEIINESHFEHIYCQLIRTTEYVKECHVVPKTLDYMDALGTGMMKRVDLQPFYSKWLFRMEAKRLFNYEQRMYDYFEHHTIISAQDRDRIRHPEAARIKIIPNGINESFFEPLTTKKEFDLVFAGNMSYPPNIHAVEFIVKKILPELPECKLLIAGAAPDERVKRLQSKQVSISGWMDDIRLAYHKSTICFAPMQIGTGLQNKLLEAMACAIPCITTTMANNALGAENGKQILIADSPKDMIDSIRKLLHDEEYRNTIASNGKEFVLQQFNWHSSVQQLIQLMRNQHDSKF